MEAEGPFEMVTQDFQTIPVLMGLSICLLGSIVNKDVNVMYDIRLNIPHPILLFEPSFGTLFKTFNAVHHKYSLILQSPN